MCASGPQGGLSRRGGRRRRIPSSSGQFHSGGRFALRATCSRVSRCLQLRRDTSDCDPSMSASREPVPFEVYEAGVYLHGTKGDLAVGDLLVPGRESNFEAGRVMNYVYFTATLDAAVWGAELAGGDGPGRIYIVEPT